MHPAGAIPPSIARLGTVIYDPMPTSFREVFNQPSLSGSLAYNGTTGIPRIVRRIRATVQTGSRRSLPIDVVCPSVRMTLNLLAERVECLAAPGAFVAARHWRHRRAPRR